MSNKPWEHEYHNENGKKWWEVRKPNSPFPNYFIVEDVGDPTDGDHLVSLLNERESLLKRIEKLLSFVESETLLSALDRYESELNYEIAECGGDIDTVPDPDDESGMPL